MKERQGETTKKKQTKIERQERKYRQGKRDREVS